MAERLKEALDKLDLNADQKEKVKVVMEEEQKKVQELMAEAQSGDRAKVREKAMAAATEIRGKLMGILTPEQQQKFKELTANAAGSQRRRPGVPAGETPKPESDSK